MTLHAHDINSRAPTPPRLSIWRFLQGLPGFVRDAPQFMLDLHNRHGHIVRLSLGLGPSVVLLSHPDYIRRVLLENYQNYARSPLYHLFNFGFGGGLVTSEGETWKRQRRILQPHFGAEHVSRYAQHISRATQSLIAHWEKLSSNTEPIDMEREMLGLARDTILRILVGTDLGESVEALRLAFLSAARTSIVTQNLPIPRYVRLVRAYRDLDRQLLQIIAQHRDSDHPGDNLVSQLLQARDPRTGALLSNQEIRDELVTLIFTGYEATAQTLTWAWHMLSQNPQAAEKLKLELKEVLGGRQPGLEDVPNLRYTSLVIRETMRLYPTSWANGRRARDADEIGGYAILPGTHVVLNRFAAHRHPDFWERPDEFVPERFEHSPEADSQDFTYFPFGAGPRRCIGRDLAMLEMKMALAALGQRFSPETVPGRAIHVDAKVILRPRDGLLMNVRQLKDSRSSM